MRLKFLCLSVLCASASLSQAVESDWRYGLPDTGLIPDSISYEAITRADSRDGESAFGLQTWGISAPLSDVTKCGYKQWMLAVELDASISYANTAGAFDLEQKTLYSLDLPIGLVRMYESGNRMTYALAPSIASDMGYTDGSFTMGAMAQYRIKHSNNFAYTLGLAYSPLYSRAGIFPMVGFEWDIDDSWSLRMSRLQLALDYKLNENVKLGPFLGFSSNAWTIHTDEGSRWLRTQSMLCGVQAELILPSASGKKHVLNVALGSTFYSRVETSYRNWSQNRDYRRYYEPSLYCSIGMDFKF